MSYLNEELQYNPSFKEAMALRDELASELQPLLNSPHAIVQEKAVELGEDLSCADDILTECQNLPVPRMQSGAPGVVYLDAILRILDAITEILEAIITGLKLYLKAARKIREWANKLAKAFEDTEEGAVEAEQSATFAEKAADLAVEAAIAVGAKIEPIVKAMSKPIKQQMAEMSTAAAEAMEKAEKELAKGRNEFTKASDYAVENVIVHLEGALAIAKAAYKMVAVVRRTISWINMVLSVEPVMFLPIPITGWDILNIYKWWTGDEVPDIMRPLILNVARGNFDPITIIQGTLRTPTVRGWIPDEAYQVPKMEFLAGGTIF